jgi:hypothetical protein
MWLKIKTEKIKKKKENPANQAEFFPTVHSYP